MSGLLVGNYLTSREGALRAIHNIIKSMSDVARHHYTCEPAMVKLIPVQCVLVMLQLSYQLCGFYTFHPGIMSQCYSDGWP